ncbi:MAG: circularly permuted type 2 ATP-grasp protein, partial [Devosiaceae bacterium]
MSQNATTTSAQSSAFGLLDGYRPLPGAHDECVDGEGNVRPAWHQAMAMWDRLPASKHRTRQQSAERYLRDNGVAHRVYGADHSIERPWPLSHMPLIIGAQEWQALEAGLIQRADLLEKILVDLYGPQKLVRDGHIP